MEPVDVSLNEQAHIQITRKVFDESQLIQGKVYSSTSSSNWESDRKQCLHTVCSKISSCSCSWQRCCQFLFRLMPILSWLPKYSIKKDLLADITGGVTVGIMHIPQGLAFAMLASLPPVTGLYTALIPVLVYMLMGTSRHLSVGSFAVISLMVAQVCERELGSMQMETSLSPSNDSDISPTSPASSNSLWTPTDAIKLEIAVSLSFLVGIIQVAMGAAQLGFLATFMSDPMISGFTTGSAVLVVISQVKHILGLKVPQIPAPLAAPKAVVYMLKNILSCNVGAIITGVLSLVILIGLKKVNERFKSKMKVPIPAELLVVVVGTAISYGAAINKNFAVSILGKIPKGLPPLSLPTFSLLPKIFPDAFVIAVVIFATNISLSKMFAKKRGYSVDPNQELIAYGVGNVAGSFSSCFAICNALARTAVQENLANTQLCSIIVIAMILLVLLFIAPLFFHLPKPILAAVVIANLVGLLRQFSRLKVLWKIHKPDAVVWFFTCFGVIAMGVDVGLGIGVMCALFAVVLTLSRPKYTLLGRVWDTELYRDVKQCRRASEVSGVKVMRFESSLYFGNVERFRSALVTIAGQDPTMQQGTRQEINLVGKGDADDNEALLENEHSEQMGSNEKSANGKLPHADESNLIEVEVAQPEQRIHTVVIDCSSFTFIDSVGLLALPSIMKEFEKIGIRILLSGCSSNITNRLVNSTGGTGTNTVDSHAMFPSIHDAVMSAAPSLDSAIYTEGLERETVL
ncbi:PREDICTED: pendrin-like isoform X2 [Acropora digitifera]|uniref:pendrin-like isoform X2 n=1 Tax=Acropora digitifera TaxID=70779 RepID=UPI00077A4898|nr:PREDICTED: pendrin-like isoform X2 [Acropora digitifera]